ncbi:MAG: hypothetical protein ACYC26_11660 [Phycisphaerales bacterium]
MPPANKSKSNPNVYTALAIIATLALAVGVGYVWHINTTLTGQGNPMTLVGK